MLKTSGETPLEKHGSFGERKLWEEKNISDWGILEEKKRRGYKLEGNVSRDARC